MARRRGEDWSNRSDQELVEGAIKDEAGAWEALVDRLTPVIHNQVAQVLLRKRGHQSVRRQDILDYKQDVFVLLLERNHQVLRTWNPARGASLSTFAGLVARRLTLSALRTGRRGAWLEDPTEDGEVAPNAVAETPSPESLALDRRTLETILDRLYELLSPQKMALFLALHRDERPIAEVSHEFEMSPNAIYTWQSRLRRILDGLVAELREGEPIHE